MPESKSDEPLSDETLSERVSEALASQSGSTMKAVLVSAFGHPDVLEYTDVPIPAVGSGQVLVEVSRAGVNFRDVIDRRGTYPTPRRPPFVAGIEGAGRVVRTGERVTHLAVGDRVAWTTAPGSYAELVVVPAAAAVRVPDGISDDQAAATLGQGLTAHYLATSLRRIEPEESVLVHAAAGGVGGLLVQIAKHRGARVIATVSTEAKADSARKAGADHVFGYEDFPDRIREVTGGEGVAVVYDGVGAPTLRGSLESLRPRGMLALYGASGGHPEPLDLNLLTAKSLFVTRPGLAHYVSAPGELQSRAAELFRWVADGTLRIQVAGRYPLARADRAHEDLEARRTAGKLLLIMR
jgi:NADPH2:quinone reductase